MYTYYVFITNEFDGTDVRETNNYHEAVQAIINFSNIEEPDDDWQILEIIKGKKIY